MTTRHRTEVVITRTGQLAELVGARLAAGYVTAMVACQEEAAGFRISYVLIRYSEDLRCEIAVNIPRDGASIPSLAALDYSIGRFEREIRDLYGVVPINHPLPYRLVRHGHWPRGWYPMRSDAGADPDFDDDVGSFPFLEVEGDGVYEIPVGPIHAGLIEPGHFRFSVVGETILRMKARLWFVHRGVEKLLEGQDPAAAIGLSERISGDTAIGHSLAFAMAVEDAAGIDVSHEDCLARALLLELERMYNHVGDLGALANDVGFGIVNVHAMRLRESLLRLNERTTGHRLLRGAITIGGAQLQELPDPDLIGTIAAEVLELCNITLANSTVRDRFTDTAVLSREAAMQLAVRGYVARASGVDIDARRDHPFIDLGPSFRVVVQQTGDVMSRYQMRVEEFGMSAVLSRDLIARMDNNLGSGTSAPTTSGGHGLGIVEGWRGAITHRVSLDEVGRLARVKVVDPSFFNWPALPVALMNTIVPDFPLANKSFNQSYAGNDL